MTANQQLYRNVRYVPLIVGAVGELLQGGLIFGWNSLALIIKQQGNFDCAPAPPPGQTCSHQESKLTLIYTVGVFAVNFAPAVCGPLLDWLGPRASAVAGTSITTLGLVLLAVSRSSGPDAFAGGAFCIGLGGVAYHLAQFNTASLFPRHRGLVSGAFVAGFVGSGLSFFVLRAVINALGGSHAAYRDAFLVYAALCALWVPLGLWVFPRRPLQLGQVYVLSKGWRFRAITIAQYSQSQTGSRRRRQRGAAAAASHEAVPPDVESAPHKLADEPADSSADSSLHEAAAMGKAAAVDEVLMGDIAVPMAEASATSKAADDEELEVPLQAGSHDVFGSQQHTQQNGSPVLTIPQHDSLQQAARSGKSAVVIPHPGGPGGKTSDPIQTLIDSSRSLGGASQGSGKTAVVIPEAARFAALKSATLKQQLMSPECLGMTAFFTVSVFVLQLYLGTSRLQLRAKGDGGVYSNLTSVVLACGGVFIPATHWLVDRRGYGATLATVNILGVLCCVFQAIPSLQVQALTLASWCASRVILYSSFYAIVGALFGMRTFGTIIGAISAFTGLVTLLILPIADAANAHLQSNDTYWILNTVQAVVLLPLFGFCAAMWRWERAAVVASRFTGAADGRPAAELETGTP